MRRRPPRPWCLGRWSRGWWWTCTVALTGFTAVSGSSRALAALAGVSHTFVDQLRRERLPPGVLPRAQVEAAARVLPLLEQRVLLALHDVEMVGSVVATTEDLAEMARITPDEVETAVQELVRRGVITVRTTRSEGARHQTSFRVTLGS